MKNNRIVKRGKAKDYERDAKYYDYYYITVNKKDYTLSLNGWNRLPVNTDDNGNFVLIENNKYYLKH